MSKTLLRHTLIKNIFDILLTFSYTFSLFENAWFIIVQLIRYARASSNYSDFLKRHLHLRNRLLDQSYEKIRLIRSLKKFIFRYQDLVEIYSVSAETIYGSKVPAVTITVFKYRNKIGKIVVKAVPYSVT
jgi:hypothetical protein